MPKKVLRVKDWLVALTPPIPKWHSEVSKTRCHVRIHSHRILKASEQLDSQRAGCKGARITSLPSTLLFTSKREVPFFP